MGDAFIVRRGGVAAGQTAQPTITFVSSTTTSITFTLTNNDASTAVILWEVGETPPNANSIELAGGATSSNLTASGLTEGDIITIYAIANATGQINSNVAEFERGTTLATPTITEVSTTLDSITFTVRNEANTAASVTYGLTIPPTTTTLELAANTTSANQTISGLDLDTSYTVFAEATKTNYPNSAIGSLAIVTEALPAYTVATGGTTAEYDSGGKRYKSHTFTSNGNFVVTTAGNGDRNQVDYLIVAGGGGSGVGPQWPVAGGGGGGGGFLTTLGTSGRNSTARAKITVTNQSYSVLVGAGGSTVAGTNSSVFGQSANGGARGSGGYETTSPATGGCGGGSFDAPGGLGLADQGFDGGSGSLQPWGGGGGGGAAANGSDAPASNSATNNIGGGAGGAGLGNTLRLNTISYYSGGGAGGAYTGSAPGGIGGGGSSSGDSGTNGAANTGGGGAGQYFQRGTSGGSGIVVIRYEIPPSV